MRPFHRPYGNNYIKEFTERQVVADSLIVSDHSKSITIRRFRRATLFGPFENDGGFVVNIVPGAMRVDMLMQMRKPMRFLGKSTWKSKENPWCGCQSYNDALLDGSP